MERTMRKIEFIPGMTESMKERVSAIAWATNHRGRNSWQSKNVTVTIAEYLNDHGYEVKRSLIQSALKAIEHYGWGWKRAGQNLTGQRGGNRIIEFGFHPDIDLTGHGLPESVGVKAPAPSDPAIHSTDKLFEDTPFPPLPAAPEPPIYRLDELSKLLKEWSEKDQETYANWVDQAVENLRRVV
jgi:hypothetical protein